mmetsp:Transcript_121364/g.343429  ORF Transcript_121364/g.343429 Transcript_121364/m.343429 type:complete len:223 (+) Transcript_121364:470-1138(+)
MPRGEPRHASGHCGRGQGATSDGTDGAEGCQQGDRNDLASNRQLPAKRPIKHVGSVARHKESAHELRAKRKRGGLVRQGHWLRSGAEGGGEQHHDPKHSLQGEERVGCDKNGPLRFDFFPSREVGRVDARVRITMGAEQRRQREGRDKPGELRRTVLDNLLALRNATEVRATSTGTSAPLQLESQYNQRGYDANRHLHHAAGPCVLDHNGRCGGVGNHISRG